MNNDPLATLVEQKLVEYTRQLGHVPTLEQLAEATSLPPGKLKSKLRQILASIKSSQRMLDRHGLVAAINTILESSTVPGASGATVGQLSDFSKFKNLKQSAADEKLKAETEAEESEPEEPEVRSVTQELLRDDLAEVMARLSPREREILSLRFGLDDGKMRTLEEVAIHLGVTTDRIRETEAAALRTLRALRPPKRPR